MLTEYDNHLDTSYGYISNNLMIGEKDDYLIAVDGKMFYAGLVTNKGKVVDAATVLCYMLGWHIDNVIEECNINQWNWQYVLPLGH